MARPNRSTDAEKDRDKRPNATCVVVTQDGRVVRITPRPTWRDSEVRTQEVFEPELSEQISFQGREQVVAGKSGSVRPDLFREGRSVEVKNYLINTPARRERLVRVIAQQAKQRAKELPTGTRQLVRLDLSGQTGVVSHLPALAAAIEERSGGVIRREDVHWILSLFPADRAT